MIDIAASLTPEDLLPGIQTMWEASGRCLDLMHQAWTPGAGAPVFTVRGKYTAQGWTEWTQGFQFGSELLQFDATGETRFLERGRMHTLRYMAPHVSHAGVHDHGFNNISTYGALRRLALEGRVEFSDAELELYNLALRVSGAVQAHRWTPLQSGGGFIYSFNGPHSLFSDTIRSLRSLAVAHSLGYRLQSENDVSISLLDRLIAHADATAKYNVYYGEGRDIYDVRGRVAHESIFNTNDGHYRCPSTQQGYSPFTTWTRGAAWVLLGFAEQLEFLSALDQGELHQYGGRDVVEAWMLHAARAVADYFIAETPPDGIPYWDTGAPGLSLIPDHRDQPADPCNDLEPVDSSAAAIAAQGFLRLGNWLRTRMDGDSERYFQTGLTILQRLLQPAYLNQSADHQGLLLHAIYHRPRGWDGIPEGKKSPHGESCQWGDYHLREVALLVQRMARNEPFYCFTGPA